MKNKKSRASEQYATYSISYLFRDFGLSKFINLCLVASIAITLLFAICVYRFPNDQGELISFSNSFFLAIVIGLLGFLIAIFAILVSFTDEKFLLFLVERRVISGYLVPILFPILLLSLSIISIFISEVLNIIDIEYWHEIGLVAFFFSVYALLETFYAVEAVKNLILLRADYIKSKDSSEKK